MSAKIYNFPQTFDGRMICIVRFLSGAKMDGRDFDEEARKIKSEFYAAEAWERAAAEAAEAEALAAIEAAKVLPFPGVRVASGDDGAFWDAERRSKMPKAKQ